MTAMRLRIRSIRPKSGGYIRLLEPRTERVHNELRDVAHTRLDEIFDSLEKRCAGYVIVAWDTQGGVSTAYNNRETSPFAGTMIPTLAEEMVRRTQTRTVVRETLGFE